MIKSKLLPVITALGILNMLPFSRQSATAEAEIPASGPQVTDVFVSGTEGYHTFRIPAVVVTNRGTVLAFCEGRKGSQNDHGDVDLVLKRSLDGGKTWAKMQRVHEEGGDAGITIGNPVPVVDQSNGTIWLFFCRNSKRLFVTRSMDDGATWSKPLEVTEQVKPGGPEHDIWTGPVHGIQLRYGAREGRLVIPCSAHDKKGTQRCWIIYSDDHGRTWQIGQPTDRGSECVAVETVGGELYLNARRRTLPDYRDVARSKDGGETWSEQITQDKNLLDTRCQASLCRYSDSKTGDKNRILYSSPAVKKRLGTTDKNPRVSMTIRVSYDECKTWSAGKVLYPGPSGYSDLCVLPDKTILCLYERGANDYREKITVARFKLDWLAEDQKN